MDWKLGARHRWLDNACQKLIWCGGYHGPYGIGSYAWFFDADALIYSPTDLTKTYPFLFLTRLVTHFCAPGFVFLAGISAYLWGRDQTRHDIFIYLSTRGLWLILFDAIVISPVWTLEFGRYSLGALWAIGSSMIALSFLIFLDRRIILTIALIIIFGHDL